MKRRIGKLCLFLLLGAIVNVAVAWGLVLRERQSVAKYIAQSRAYQRNSSSTERTTLYTQAGELLLSQMHDTKRVSITCPLPVISEEGYASIVPEWSDFAGNEPILKWMHRLESSDIQISFTEHSSGWPALAWRSRLVERFALPSTRFIVHSDGVLLPPDWQTVERHALPIRPIWPGFAMNTIFYAAIMWLLFAFPFALRRRLRIKRGLCPACAYPVGESDVCTECGKPTKKD